MREVFNFSFFNIIIVFTCGVLLNLGVDSEQKSIVRERDRTLAYLSTSLVSTSGLVDEFDCNVEHESQTRLKDVHL